MIQLEIIGEYLFANDAATFVTGSGLGLVLPKLLRALLRLLTLAASLMTIWLFCKEHKRFSYCSILMVIFLFLCFGCTSHPVAYLAKGEESSTSKVISNDPSTGGIYCRDEVRTYRNVLRLKAECAKSYKAHGFIPATSHEECRSFDREVLEAKAVYITCKRRELRKHVLLNPFNLSRKFY